MRSRSKYGESKENRDENNGTLSAKARATPRTDSKEERRKSMIPMDIPIDAALNVRTPAAAPAQPAEAKAATGCQKSAGRTDADACQSSSFHDELRAVHDQLRAAEKEPSPSSAAGSPRSEDSGCSQPAAAKITESQGQPAGHAPCRPESKQEHADLWSFLLQALQGISAALEPAESVSEPEADAAGADLSQDDTAETLSQLLDILKQVRDAAQDILHPSADAARLSALCDQLKEVTAAAVPGELPVQIQPLLQELREQLSDMAWGRMMKEMAVGEPVADPGAEDAVSPADVMTPVRPAAPDTAQDAPEGSLQAILRKFRAEAQDPIPTAPESRAASTPGPASEDAKLKNVEHETPLRLPSTPAAVAGEAGRGLETARPAAATIDASGPLMAVREDPGASSEENRQPADNRMIAKALAGVDTAKPEGADPAEPFEVNTAGQRLLHLQDGGLEKAAGAVAAGKEKEAAGTGRAGIFDQIVQRAIVQVKAGQSEIKIDLKPDFLGNVRMQIVSENQQVSVRILTELPVVRDMIEAGLQQLRSELQNQGLHVDRLEVAVSDDPRQPPRRQARPDELQKGGEAGAASGKEGPVSGGRIEPIYYQRRTGSAGTIDMFV